MRELFDEVAGRSPLDPQRKRFYASVGNFAPRPSFGDRIITCLDDAAAAGLGPNERAAYSRACANR